MLLIWFTIVGLGFDPGLAFVGGALAPGCHALPIDGVDLHIGKVPDFLV